jgi:hypothetical protein
MQLGEETQNSLSCIASARDYYFHTLAYKRTVSDPPLNSSC